jgi:hypothetical protein
MTWWSLTSTLEESKILYLTSINDYIQISKFKYLSDYLWQQIQKSMGWELLSYCWVQDLQHIATSHGITCFMLSNARLQHWTKWSVWYNAFNLQSHTWKLAMRSWELLVKDDQLFSSRYKKRPDWTRNLLLNLGRYQICVSIWSYQGKKLEVAQHVQDRLSKANRGWISNKQKGSNTFILP